MHPCLLISEITSLFCTQLRDDNSRRSLAAVAQTCRALSEIALDALWYELNDIQLLVRCMPPDLWESGSTELVWIDVCIVLYRS
jgi:hypothetical protein